MTALDYRSEVPSVALRACADCGAALNLPHAKWCDDCRWRHRGKPAKYVWTAERDQLLRDHYDGSRGVALALGRRIGFPDWTVVKRAAQLGLTKPVDRRTWTDEETALLTQYLGNRTTKWIARQLGRSETSVVMRAKRLRLSRSIDNGYSSRQVAEGFGVDSHKVARWIQRGQLDGRQVVANGGPHETWAITNDAIRKFVKTHPLAFDIRKVDQVWFLDVLGMIAAEAGA